MKEKKVQVQKKNYAGFTLIEMIGVLAIIALLAGMLVPRIVEAIREARISSTVESINTLKAAVAQYYAKHGTLKGLYDNQNPGQGGTAKTPDEVLVEEGYLDKKFEPKVGTQPTSGNYWIYCRNSGDLSNPDRYNLDGQGGKDTANAAYLVEVVLYNVSPEDANKISLSIDGESLTSDVGSNDTTGRVVYQLETNDQGQSVGKGTVYIYIAHE